MYCHGDKNLVKNDTYKDAHTPYAALPHLLDTPSLDTWGKWINHGI